MKLQPALVGLPLPMVSVVPTADIGSGATELHKHGAAVDDEQARLRSPANRVIRLLA